MRTPLSIRALSSPVLAGALLLLATPALAVDFYLRVDEVTVTMPDGATIPMWGFALDTDGDFGTIEYPAQVPGPRLTVPVGDSTVNIYVHNALDVNQPVSLVIPGQPMGMSPVRFAPTDPDYPDRIRSSTHETAQGMTELYTWPSFRSGTFLYKSGTQPQVQVQMGLYGAITQDFAAGQAYDGIAYDVEELLLYSEIDPALHDAVTTPGGYGPGGAVTSTLGYDPKYFLIDGQPWSAAAPIELSGFTVGDNVLLRFVSAGLETHVPTLLGGHWSLVSEDGFPLPHPVLQSTVALVAGKTHDVVFNPDRSGAYPLVDRALSLTNDGAPGGGMLARLVVAGVAGSPYGAADSYAVDEDGTLVVDGMLLPAVIANDSDGGAPGTDPLVATLYQNVLHGAFAFAGDGTFTYTPAADYFGADFFLYTVFDGDSSSEPITATIRVDPINDPPLTVADSYSTYEDLELSRLAPGVLGNDIDIDGDPLIAVLAAAPANGALTLLGNGSFTYAPDPDWFGVDSFQYEARDASTSGGTVTVTITVQPVNDVPVAVLDVLPAVITGTPFIMPAPGVLANDWDPEGSPLTAALDRGPNHGALTLNPDGSLEYTPDPDYSGSDSFTYRASDGSLSSVAVKVWIFVNPIFFDGFENGLADGWSQIVP